jgi:hypothetical protein
MIEQSAIQGLLDKQAITEQIHRYCRAVDRLDIPLGHAVWHDDATAEYGGGYHSGPGKDVIDKICADHRKLQRHSHQIANILIELDGDTAGSESYVTAMLQGMRGGTLFQITTCSRYIDRWSRRNGRWALDHRMAIRDFDEVRDIRGLSVDPLSRRDREDPSYCALRAQC